MSKKVIKKICNRFILPGFLILEGNSTDILGTGTYVLGIGHPDPDIFAGSEFSSPVPIPGST